MSVLTTGYEPPQSPWPTEVPFVGSALRRFLIFCAGAVRPGSRLQISLIDVISVHGVDQPGPARRTWLIVRAGGWASDLRSASMPSILTIASAELGTSLSSNRSKVLEYIRVSGGSQDNPEGRSWCGDFAFWVLSQAKVSPLPATWQPRPQPLGSNAIPRFWTGSPQPALRCRATCTTGRIRI
jgi:hypothetical protein